MVKTNTQYTEQEFNQLEAAARNIIERAIRSLRYGFDMVSSRAACIEDCAAVALRAISEEAPIKLGQSLSRDNSRPLHVEASAAGKYYIVVDAHGNFFAKTYSHSDAELIAGRC